MSKKYHAICIRSIYETKDGPLRLTIVNTEIYETNDKSMDSVNKILEKSCGKRYTKKLHFKSKHVVFDWYNFETKDADYRDYVVDSVQFQKVKKIK